MAHTTDDGSAGQKPQSHGKFASKLPKKSKSAFELFLIQIRYN
jgi:hypothetical protein